MKLSKIKLYNYRCFGSETVINLDGINAFVGDNGTGKTAALAALNSIFASRPSDRILTKSDFHINPEDSKEQDAERHLYIEVVFEMNELSDNNCSGQAVASFFKRLTTKTGTDDLILRIRLEATWQKSSNINGSIDSKIYFIPCDEDDPNIDEKKVEAKRAQLDQIRVIYVPAVRNPSSQLRNVSGTFLNQILQKVNWSENTKAEVERIINELNLELSKDGTIQALNKILNSSWDNYSSDTNLSDAHLLFSSSNLNKALTDTGVSFRSPYSNGETSIDELSDGLKSLFYISLVESVLETEYRIQSEEELNLSADSKEYLLPAFTMIALEEPENHISPHRLGKLVLNLRNLSKKFNCQVVVSSHSPSIIKRIDPEEVRYFRKNPKTESSEVLTLTLPDEESEADQYKFVKGAVQAYPELYFAKLVVLGEGESEEIILPKIWEHLNSDLDVDGVSVVPLGGRHVNHFWRLLNDLHIPHVTLLDLDRERSGGGWGRIHYVIDQLVKVGIPKNKLLKTSSGIMSDDQFSGMIDWGYDASDVTVLEGWISFLEKYGVFFSSPLDIDFLMLEQWEDLYIDSFPLKDGPRVKFEDPELKTSKTKKIIEIRKEGIASQPLVIQNTYKQRIDEAVKATLKKHGGIGDSFSEEQKELMIWYVYHFLDRGKPATHIQVITDAEWNILFDDIPDVLIRLCEYGAKILKDGSGYADC